MKINTLKRVLSRSYYSFLIDFFVFKRMSGVNRRFSVFWKDRNPQLFDKTGKTPFDPHYLYHPAWAARVLAQTKPQLHIDISSILSFSTIISAFIPVRFYD